VSYEPTRIDVSGNLPIQRSVLPGEAPSKIKPGDLAVNAADGVVYVGKVNGTAGTIPGAVGFNQIVSLTQSQYNAITATASATTLYIVTPNPS
jgi:hypothetical protein